jgi:Tfp pilus assembly protein PilF
VGEAIGELKETLRLDSNNRPAKRLLAQAYEIQKQPDQAKHYLEEAESAEVPQAVGAEAEDFFFPDWQMPPADQRTSP